MRGLGRAGGRAGAGVWLLVLLQGASATWAAQPPDRVESLARLCERCHGKDGNARDLFIPSLAGISPDYLMGAIGDFAAGYRPAREVPLPGSNVTTDMRQIAAGLDPADVEGLAYHFSHKTLVPRRQAYDPELAAEGEQIHRRYCGRCHTHGGYAADDGAAVLAGQPIAYLRYTFNNFISGRRYVSHKMRLKFKAMYRKHGEAGLERLLHFYASRQP